MFKIILSIIIISTFSYVISNAKSTPVTATGDRAGLAKELSQEIKIKDFTLENSQLLALLVSDGTNRNGYAMYLCEVARSYNVHNIRITIMDANMVMMDNNGYEKYTWKQMTIGKIHCK